jgi:site-specific recombinase XerD
MGTFTPVQHEEVQRTSLPVQTNQLDRDLESLHNTFLEFMGAERGISDLTLYGYSTDFVRFVTFLRERAEPLELRSFTAEVIRDHQLALSRHVTSRGGGLRRLSPITIKRHLASLSSFGEWLVMSKHLQVNPVKNPIRPERRGTNWSTCRAAPRS